MCMTGISSSDSPGVHIDALLDEFYGPPVGHAELGQFEPQSGLPAPYDSLLDHHHHMTVTVESHYGTPVDVLVHRCHRQDRWYSREITLLTSDSRQIVQYGIVRLDVSSLEDEVWQQIESQTLPLGRVLIEHNVLREVQLCGLWRVTVGPSLARIMQLSEGDTLYGRTALIYCNGVPAIELLEIVSPTS